ncbi:hypothetical protein LguiA_012824 [Lonicera macranthoides]
MDSVIILNLSAQKVFIEFVNIGTNIFGNFYSLHSVSGSGGSNQLHKGSSSCQSKHACFPPIKSLLYLLNDVFKMKLFDPPMNEWNPKVSSQIFRGHDATYPRKVCRLPFTHIRRNIHFRFLEVNSLSRVSTKGIQNIHNHPAITLFCLSKEDRIIYKHKVSNHNPRLSCFNTNPFVVIHSLINEVR